MEYIGMIDLYVRQLPVCDKLDNCKQMVVNECDSGIFLFYYNYLAD